MSKVRGRLGVDVFDAAVTRLYAEYSVGHRIIVGISGGKDSTVTLEVAIIAAGMAGRLPVEACIQDEEAAYPGTYEYVERVAQRTGEVKVDWLVCNQPMLNKFNRGDPYWWVFDDRIDPEQWMRRPPSWARVIPDKSMYTMINPRTFPVDSERGQRLYACVGLRTAESVNRKFAVFGSGGHIAKPNSVGAWKLRPVYDWEDSDVWRAINENGWDYNKAYDVFCRAGMRGKDLRIGPPTMTFAALKCLRVAAQAWPNWFDRLCTRCPGTRLAVNFGLKALTPQRKAGETWQQVFERECISKAVPWIRERAEKVRDKVLERHAVHSTVAFPEVKSCYLCNPNGFGSWRVLAMKMFDGNPFSMGTHLLKDVPPEFFRPGAGQWEVA